MLRNRLFRHPTTPAVVLVITLTLGNLAWAGSNYKVLHSFKGGEDGAGVHAGVALDGGGNLYGTTSGGGAHGYGTVFELTPGRNGKWAETILHSFCKDFPRCTDGTGPDGGVVLDPSGNLYGTTNTLAFELLSGKDSWTYSVISHGAAGSSLTIDGAGNLYGAGGSVWELVSASGWKVKEFHIFCRTNCRDGWEALAPPVLDPAGNLYGTTEFGGNIDTQWCLLPEAAASPTKWNRWAAENGSITCCTASQPSLTTANSPSLA